MRWWRTGGRFLLCKNPDSTTHGKKPQIKKPNREESNRSEEQAVTSDAAQRLLEHELWYHVEKHKLRFYPTWIISLKLKSVRFHVTTLSHYINLTLLSKINTQTQYRRTQETNLTQSPNLTKTPARYFGDERDERNFEYVYRLEWDQQLPFLSYVLGYPDTRWTDWTHHRPTYTPAYNQLIPCSPSQPETLHKQPCTNITNNKQQ